MSADTDIDLKSTVPPRVPAQVLSGRWWASSLVAAVIGAVVFAFARTSLIDDAYITLDYARNVAFHLHWGLILGATANTATSPLNVLAIALFTAITRHPPLSLGIVFVLSTVALEFGSRTAARAVGLPGWLGLLATALVSVNPLLLSSIGLETALGGGLVALLLAASVTGRPVWSGVLAGLLVLTRPDLLIVALVLFFVRPGWRHGWARSLLAALAVTLPWYLFSWLRLGSVLPDTLIIKTGQRSWGGIDFGNGPDLYLTAFPTAAVLSFLPAALGGVTALGWLAARFARPTDRLRRLDRFVALPVAGGLYYLAYTLLGVPPYHWYYGPSIICPTLFLAAVVAALPSGPVRRSWPVLAGLVVSVGLVAASAGSYAAGGLPRQFAPFTTNWASPGEYARIGAQVGRLAGGRTVASFGEIGAVAYFCDCAMLDEFSDRGAVVGLVNAKLATGSTLKRDLLSWNFRFLDRTQRPATPQLVLTYTGAPVANALGAWRVHTMWLGPGPYYISLVPRATKN